MINFSKSVALAAILAVAAPVAASAMSLSGQVDIVGTIDLNNSTFSPTGEVDFVNDAGLALFATDDFAGLIGSIVDLTDIDFSALGQVWEVLGFSFTATSVGDFVDTTLDKGFSANGVISANGFDDTPGFLSFSSQSNDPNQVIASFSSTTSAVPVPAAGLLLLTGLGGMAAMRRRKSKS